MDVGPWDVAAVVIKTVTYAATFAVTGGALFLAYSASLISAQQGHRIRRWLGLCILFAIAGSLLRIAVLAGSMGESTAGMLDKTMISMVLQAGELRATSLRVVALVVASFGLVFRRHLTVVTIAGALLASASFAWIGHAWASGTGALLVGVQGVHLICAGFWIGALPPLHRIASEGNLPELSSIASRFGNVAIWLVALLIAAGATLLASLLGSPTELWTTPYGRLVTVKLGAVVCLLGLATINRLRLTPRLAASDRQSARTLIRSIEAEMVVGAFILFVTAALTTVTGPAALE